MNRRVQKTAAAAAPKPRKSTPPSLGSVPKVFRRKRPVIARATNTETAPRVDRPAYRLSLPMLLLICLSIGVAAGGFLYHLHVRFEGVRLGYEASRARKAQTQLMLDRRELRLELASMKEPGRIEDEAREKLGMETPEFDRIVPVNKKRRVVSVSGGAL